MNVERYFNTRHVDLTTAGTVKEILRLNGAEAVIIKALIGNNGNLFIGNKDVSSSNGFELAPGESLKIEYLPEKATEEHITLYGVSSNSGDDVCLILVP